MMYELFSLLSANSSTDFRCSGVNVHVKITEENRNTLKKLLHYSERTSF